MRRSPRLAWGRRIYGGLQRLGEICAQQPDAHGEDTVEKEKKKEKEKLR